MGLGFTGMVCCCKSAEDSKRRGFCEIKVAGWWWEGKLEVVRGEHGVALWMNGRDSGHCCGQQEEQMS